MIIRIETSPGGYAASQPEYIENHPCGGPYIYNSCISYGRTKFPSREDAEAFIEKCKKWTAEKVTSGAPDFSTWKIIEMSEQVA